MTRAKLLTGEEINKELEKRHIHPVYIQNVDSETGKWKMAEKFTGARTAKAIRDAVRKRKKRHGDARALMLSHYEGGLCPVWFNLETGEVL